MKILLSCMLGGVWAALKRRSKSWGVSRKCPWFHSGALKEFTACYVPDALCLNVHCLSNLQQGHEEGASLSPILKQGH